MIKNKYYKVSTINNKKIVLFSDIHYCNLFNTNVLVKIIEDIKKNKPDYICIAGDIVDDPKSLDTELGRNIIIDFLTSLGSITTTFFIIGNHDQITFTGERYLPYDREEFYLNLSIDNVHYLSNSNYIIDNINFVGFTPHVDYYARPPYENKEIMLTELNKLENLVNDDYYNILLFHSPINIFDDHITSNCTFFSNINLILSGHMHNGLTPKIFEKFKFNKGLISPLKEFFPELARGTKIVDDTTLIISGGITKITPRTSPFLHKIKYKQTSHIEYIEI